jgi:hypothetical protein
MFAVVLLEQVTAQMNWWNRRGESRGSVYGLGGDDDPPH